MKGKFITFEGCEGAGKSTQIKLLESYFNRTNYPVYFTREPGGTKISERIRDIILDTESLEMDPVAELMLYAASRRQLTTEVIKEKLANGVTVICDRYIDSTTAYQGFGRGLDLEIIYSLNNWAMGDVKIDFTIFLDVPPEKGFLRKKKADEYDRLEREKEDFHLRVYEGYKWLLEKAPERIARVDGTLSKERIFEQIIELLKQWGILIKQ